MIDIIVNALATYAVTFVLVSSSLFEPLRDWVAAHTPGLKVTTHPHPVNCRMCAGFWVSLFIVAYTGFDVVKVLAVYGLSYFMATQER